MAVYLDSSCWHVKQAYDPTPAATSISPLRGVQHPRAPVVLAHMRQYGREPVNLWRVINALTKAEDKEGDDRGQRRFRRLCFWVAIRELLKVKMLYRHYAEIATADFAYRSRRRPAKRLLPSARRSDSESAGSNLTEPQAEKTVQAPKTTTTPAGKATSINQTAQAPPLITQSAGTTRPTAEQVCGAATLLAQRPHPRKRKWTGVLNGERVRRNTLVAVPTGEVLRAILILRGWVYVIRSPDEPDRFMERFKASEVRRIANPAAQVLGSLKRGVRERPSEAKRRACLSNCSKPPRAGKRPRGRPRRTGGAAGPTPSATAPSITLNRVPSGLLPESPILLTP